MLALVALILGVVDAGARSSATRTVTVQVIGKGTVTSSPGGISCGNGDTTCYATFAEGDPDKLTAKPSGGWTFDSGGAGWNGCATSTATECTPGAGNVVVTVTFNPTSGVTNSTLSVTYGADDPAVTGDEGSVTSSGVLPDPIACGSSPPGSDCTSVVPTGSVLTLFQAPAAGGVFLGWGGSCTGQSVSCTVRLDGDRQVGADWAPAGGSTAQLTVAISGSGHVSGGGINCPSTCVANEALNSAVTLDASPADGYVFTGWTGGCTGTSPACTVTMSAATSVTAAFAPANVLTVAVSGSGAVTGGSGAINCGGGATICAAGFADGATVSLVATPAVGATFTGWTGACGGTATTCTVSMTESRDVSATFSSGPATGFTLTVSVTGNGTVTGGGISCGSGATTCSSAGHATNSIVTLTAAPSAGAAFTGWGGGTCTGTTTTCTVTFNAAKTVTASFSGGSSTFALTVSATGPGRISGNGINCGNGATVCTVTLAQGTTATLTETPATGASFGGWGGACTGTAASCAISMTSAKSVSATFAAPGTPGTLTLRVVGRGSVSTSVGACASTGTTKTCVQHFKAGATATLTARAALGQSFLGWAGACSGKKVTCAVKLAAAQTATASFSNTPVKTATLRSLGPPIVRKTSAGYRVTLRFVTTAAGTARVRALRAGRTITSVAARVAQGQVRIGPFPVIRSGFYTFETRLAGGVLKTRACLGRCGPAAPPPTFVLTREAPKVTRTGDVWSVVLRVHANQLYDGRIRTYRGSRLLVDQHFLGRAGRAAFGPFLLGSGNYTLRLVAVDGYGRPRTLTWLVSLGR
ncbi:MAG TPA: hypothetical protein VH760_11555 [Gaiellaceae bacterium]|jgi:uncharacterized repeat protein (TIGR02543 family)